MNAPRHDGRPHLPVIRIDDPSSYPVNPELAGPTELANDPQLNETLNRIFQLGETAPKQPVKRIVPKQDADINLKTRYDIAKDKK